MMKTIRKAFVLGTIALLLALSRADALDSQLALTNAALVVTVNTSNATLSVLDRRTDVSGPSGPQGGGRCHGSARGIQRD
jgi:hypothetical protein